MDQNDRVCVWVNGIWQRHYPEWLGKQKQNTRRSGEGGTSPHLFLGGDQYLTNWPLRSLGFNHTFSVKHRTRVEKEKENTRQKHPNSLCNYCSRLVLRRPCKVASISLHILGMLSSDTPYDISRNNSFLFQINIKASIYRRKIK